MRTDQNFSNEITLENYYLNPGYVIVPKKPMSISTVVGSALCICLYDAKRKIGGMNHFQLPFIKTKGKTTPMYGNVSTHVLIKMFLEDTSKENIEAQFFGGAFNPAVSSKDVGKENIAVATKILSKAGIPVVSSDVGGSKGRKIIYNTHINEVAVLRVDKLRTMDWYPYT